MMILSLTVIIWNEPSINNQLQLSSKNHLFTLISINVIVSTYEKHLHYFDFEQYVIIVMQEMVMIDANVCSKQLEYRRKIFTAVYELITVWASHPINTIICNFVTIYCDCDFIIH